MGIDGDRRGYQRECLALGDGNVLWVAPGQVPDLSPAQVSYYPLRGGSGMLWAKCHTSSGSHLAFTSWRRGRFSP